MKKLSKFVTAALVALLIVYASVVTYIEQSKPVLPPEDERLHAFHHISWASRPLSLDKLADEADYIAHIRIGDWLGEHSGYGDHYFEATALSVCKGDLPEKFILSQDTGIAPIFTYGNELFLFLNRNTNSDVYAEIYRIADSDRTISYVAYDADGAPYVVPHIYNKALTGFALGAECDHAELQSYLMQNDPVLWSEQKFTLAHRMDKLVERIGEILAADIAEPPALSVSVGGEIIPLEPREFSWSSQSGEYASPDAAHPLLLSDEEWSELPYLDIGAEKFEVLCPIEPQYVNIQAWHESYRGTDDPWNTTLVERSYIVDEDGVFETRAHGGYVYVVTVGWDSDPGSETPQFKGHADFAFRVGKSAEVDAEKITLASFDEYPAEQLSNLLADTPRDEMRGRFGEPDISSEYNDLWLTDGGKYVQATYHPGDDSVFYIRSSLGLPSTPPILVTIDGVSYPVVTGNASWMYSVDGVVESGLQACHADLQNRNWSADTIYTDAREAVITLDVSERIAERIDVTIDGAEITADGAGEAFPLYYGGFTYMFTAFISEKCGEGEDPLFSGTVDCAFRAVAEPE